MTYAVCHRHVHGEPPRRDEPPDEISLPLAARRVRGHRVYHASALLPEEEELAWIGYVWRQRFRERFADVRLLRGSWNPQMGRWRSWQTPYRCVLVRSLVAYAVCHRRTLLRDLRRRVRYLGKKRAHGRGRIVRIEAEHVEEDRSLVWRGRAMRYLPDEEGLRLCRPRPPYWNSVGAIRCCDVGDPYVLDSGGEAW